MNPTAIRTVPIPATQRVDAPKRDAQENTVNKPYRFLSWREHLALAVAAAGAAVLVATGAVAPFAADGRTPYFGNDAASLAAVAGCRELPPRAERHACLRKVAAAREAAAHNALALARPAR
jgi:hypothetical protein